MYKFIIKEVFKESGNAIKDEITSKEFQTFGEAVEFLESKFYTQYLEETCCWYVNDRNQLIPNCIVTLHHQSKEGNYEKTD